MTSRIVLTVPDDIADAMRQQTPDIYLDVFGNVRLRESQEKVGNWARIAPGIVHRYVEPDALAHSTLNPEAEKSRP